MTAKQRTSTMTMLSRAILQLTRSFRRAASTVTPSNKGSATSPTPKHGSPTTQQAPNYPTTWSTNQAPRPGPGTSPRFEQTNMELQPNPLSAMELIANEPVRIVHGRKAVCDGGLVLFCTFILSWLTVSYLVVLLLKYGSCFFTSAGNSFDNFKRILGNGVCTHNRRRTPRPPENLHQPGKYRVVSCSLSFHHTDADVFVSVPGPTRIAFLRVCRRDAASACRVYRTRLVVLHFYNLSIRESSAADYYPFCFFYHLVPVLVG